MSDNSKTRKYVFTGTALDAAKVAEILGTTVEPLYEYDDKAKEQAKAYRERAKEKRAAEKAELEALRAKLAAPQPTQ